MILKKTRFITEDGLKMFGLLHLPENKTDKVVIFIHGMHSNCTKERDDAFAEELTDNGIAYFSFNNRGAECIIKLSDKLYGTVYERFTDCVYDINGAINKMQEEGFKDIHLLGHSLGSSKIVYWHNKSKNYNVKSMGLLSLTDLADETFNYIGKEKYLRAIEFAKNKVEIKKGYEFMPREAFPLPISAKSFLKLFEKGGECDFIQYGNKEWDAEMLKQIDIPLFMRYGTTHETLVQPVETVIETVRKKLQKNNLDISFIDGADHSYHGREEQLAKEYLRFLEKNM